VGHLAQYLVAGFRTEQVVDRLEPVEIGDGDRERCGVRSAVGGKLGDGASEAKKRAVDFADIATAALRDVGEIALKRANEFKDRVKP